MSDLSKGHAFLRSGDEREALAALRKENEALTALLTSTEAQLAETQQKLKEKSTAPDTQEFYVERHTDNAVGSRPAGTSVNSYAVSYSASRIFKVILVGDSGVGKTTFARQFCFGQVSANLKTTVGIDFYTKSFMVDEERMSLKLWDTAGTERYRSISKSYMRDADGIILMYDVAEEKSFLNVHQWMGDIREKAREGVVVMIIGNKVDLVDRRSSSVQVPSKAGRNVAETYRAHFAELSAMSGDNVVNAFLTLGRALKEAEDDELEGARKIAFELSVEPEEDLKPVERNPCC